MEQKEVSDYGSDQRQEISVLQQYCRITSLPQALLREREVCSVLKQSFWPNLFQGLLLEDVPRLGKLPSMHYPFPPAQPRATHKEHSRKHKVLYIIHTAHPATLPTRARAAPTGHLPTCPSALRNIQNNPAAGTSDF